MTNKLTNLLQVRLNSVIKADSSISSDTILSSDKGFKYWTDPKQSGYYIFYRDLLAIEGSITLEEMHEKEQLYIERCLPQGAELVFINQSVTRVIAYPTDKLYPNRKVVCFEAYFENMEP
ncbi:hypothetical protein A1D22_01325 [Pasteurellaceae bacterium LFhippo2]|nr:hypothetical protein [Pasteurellaceae bacterium LFhippo2]